MITFDRATLTYPDATEPTLRDVTLEIPEGELALVVGRTGCGKSSLLRLVNGLAPSFTGGTLAGSVVVDGAASLRELNRQLGYTFPVDGPKTLNGLILEHLQEIPEPGTSLKLAGHPVEILQTQHRSIKSVRLARPIEKSIKQ